ncbi:hypothetical protein M9H77_26932 [Catharanthus roseus]|uniref:Uncharacterized protein n=1 Tax=Catharanthus roseus TaxID=4058 RepID=A0ACC0AD79_CATRO|nr:hypothetical protein M9H77_26932 [Catharanthus roseus]
MKSFYSVSHLSETKGRSYLCSLFIVASLFCFAYFAGSAFFAKDYKMFSGFRINCSQPQHVQPHKCKTSPRVERGGRITGEIKGSNECMEKCRSPGSEALPEGIVSKTSDLEMRPLWGPVSKDKKLRHSVNLLAIAVGIKQKEVVNQIVKKFLENNFVVMLFHYDGIVDEWNQLQWSSQVIHVSATNQTKWWFSKRFLHPDIVAEYDYIFLWDEDLGVENFNPGRYLSIVKEEGLEISQPALDPGTSEIHHQITARRRKARVHRRIYKFKGSGRCDQNSTSPPCVGWVEMMAPVFSRAAWRCAWYMIQNDLIHAWGLDMKLGYCAQGDRAIKVGVVDSEYIVHIGLPTLGGNSDEQKLIVKSLDHSSQAKGSEDPDELANSAPKFDNRSAVRKQSYIEMRIFKRRWDTAVKKDECWNDPYQNNSTVQVVK